MRKRKIVLSIIAALAVATLALAQSRDVTFTQLLEGNAEIARYLSNGGQPLLMLTPGWECQETVDNETWGQLCAYTRPTVEVPAEEDTPAEGEAPEEGGDG